MTPIPALCTSQAFACYMAALTVDANHVDSLKAVAALYKSRGMLAEALAAYERAQAVTSTDEVRSWLRQRLRS